MTREERISKEFNTQGFKLAGGSPCNLPTLIERMKAEYDSDLYLMTAASDRGLVDIHVPPESVGPYITGFRLVQQLKELDRAVQAFPDRLLLDDARELSAYYDFVLLGLKETEKHIHPDNIDVRTDSEKDDEDLRFKAHRVWEEMTIIFRDYESYHARVADLLEENDRAIFLEEIKKPIEERVGGLAYNEQYGSFEPVEEAWGLFR